VLRDNSPPADKRLTICHTGRAPNRNTHARPATASASNASATPLPAASTEPSIGSNASAQRVNSARISSARATNRRSQPRTVSAGTPNRSAIDRHPSPATFASIATPITATSSWRRNKHKSGSSTCVPAQPRHRVRRGRHRQSPDTRRNTRSRACPHGSQHLPTRRTRQQPADQLSLDPRLLGAYDQHRVPPPASREPSRRRSNRREGSRAFRNPPSLPAPATTRPDPELRERPRACRNQASLNTGWP